jgi:hypothetical protein
MRVRAASGSEDAVPPGTHQRGNDQKHDADDEVSLEQLHDTYDRDYNRKNPEQHGHLIPPLST